MTEGDGRRKEAASLASLEPNPLTPFPVKEGETMNNF
jgi:hypothetical protein